jgi:hypothetical protein
LVRGRGRKTTIRAVVILLALAGGMMISANPVHAQGLFDVLNKMFGGWISPPPAAETMGSGGGPVAYCVRLCDGHYFPMPTNAGAPRSSPDKICNALCPASATKIYTGSGIDQASAADGTPYSKLQNAFVYRERMVSDCTCNGKETGGTATMDIHSDPTLRAGDIVATKDGLMVFTGSKEAPHQTSDFIPAEDYKGLPAGVRRTLAELRVTPEPDRAAAALAVSAAPAAPAAEASATPVAEAFPIF